MGTPKGGMSFKTRNANPKNTVIKHKVENVLKNHRPSLTKGRSFFNVALIKIIKHRISATNCVIAKSGAFRIKKPKHKPNPTAPTAITLEIISLTSTAIIAPTIINSKSNCNSNISHYD